MEKNVAQLAYHEKLWTWFETHKKQVLGGAVVLAAAALIVSYYVWNESQKDLKASWSLSQALAATAFSGNAQGASAETYLKLASEHTGTTAAAQAILLAGEALFAQGKYADAQTQFQRFLRENPGNSFAAQASFGVAASLEALGKTDEAARAYREVFERNPGANVASHAKFSLGRIYESQNKLEEACRLYEEIAQVDSYGSIGSEAAIRLEGLRPKLASATPASVSVTNVITVPGK